MDLKLMDHAAFHAEPTKDLCNFTMRGGSLSAGADAVVRRTNLPAAGNVLPDGKGHGNNFSHYGVAIPGIDDLLDKTMAEPDLEKRLALCRKIDEKMLTDLPVDLHLHHGLRDHPQSAPRYRFQGRIPASATGGSIRPRSSPEANAAVPVLRRHPLSCSDIDIR